jgi:hypothetical protein
MIMKGRLIDSQPNFVANAVAATPGRQTSRHLTFVDELLAL